jgi:hypothetical protein
MRLHSKIRKNSQEKKPPAPRGSADRQGVTHGPEGQRPPKETITISALRCGMRNILASMTRPCNGQARKFVELGSSVRGDLGKQMEKLRLDYLPPREGAKQRRFKKSELDFIVSGNSEAIDLTLMNGVRLAMGPGVSDTLSDACSQRQLFPVKLIDALNLATFLARVVVAARIAQRITGCPASVLIADAWLLAAMQASPG